MLRRAAFLVPVAFLLLGPLSLLRADADEDDLDLPVVGQPASFNGAVGIFTQPTVTVDRPEVQVEKPLKLTVRVTATAPVKRPPKRPNLKELPDFDEQFYIEDLPDPPARPRVWEFAYRLKPRSEQVKAVPSWAFTYFHPDFLNPNHPARSKGYQTHYTNAIPLSVKLADKVKLDEVQSKKGPLQAPDSVGRLADAGAVLQRSESGLGLGLVAVGLFVVGTPALCLGWYALWRRRHPDAGRLARQRRSRAAQHALQALAGDTGSNQPQRIVSLVARYLRERLDLATAEPTPAEATACLQRAGFSAEPTRKASEFFAACDAIRFAPASPAGHDDLRAAAEDFILALEAESWPA